MHESPSCSDLVLAVHYVSFTFIYIKALTAHYSALPLCVSVTVLL